MSKYSPEFMSGRHRKPMSIKFIQQAIKDRGILEAIVLKCNNDKSLEIDLGNRIKGLIPFSELEYNYNGDKTKAVAAVSKVGKHIKFVAKSIEDTENGYLVHCSRKEAQKICFDNYISKLLPGDVIPARVVRIENYGIFCDIGCGIISLLPTNMISVTHTINPKETLASLKELKVVVKSIDENYRIQLSHKELLGTWQENAEQFSEKQVVYGTVLSVEDYGVFVRIAQNLSGLAEIPEDIKLNTGDVVSVRINSIVSKNMKIKLSVLDKMSNTVDIVDSFKYVYTKSHMNKWVYSTDDSSKVIQSVFQ